MTSMAPSRCAACAAGRKKALRAILADFKENYIGTDGVVTHMPIGIVDSDAEKDARWLEDQLRKEPGCQDIPIIHSSVSPVIGAHVGPGMVAVAFWGKDRRETLSVHGPHRAPRPRKQVTASTHKLGLPPRDRRP